MAADDSTVLALICLGSNIEPDRNVPRALEALSDSFRVTKVSSYYASPAKNAPGTPPFVNAAAAVLTELAPEAVKFDVLRPIETRMGRVRGDDPNAPRTIDLDLSLFGDLVIDDPDLGLVIPDPEILTSAHVALPLAEIAGAERHPVDGRTLAEVARPFEGDPTIRVVGRLPAE